MDDPCTASFLLIPPLDITKAEDENKSFIILDSVLLSLMLAH